MLYSALIFGLISSLHCVGMCGPIAMMIPLDRNNPSKKVIQIMAYQIGRLSAYAVLGLVFGLLGRGFFMAGLQQQLSIFVGVMMILLAVVPENKLAQYNFSKPVYHLISKVKQQLGKQLKNKSLKSLYLIGLFNGFLPCGMVYAALFGAIAMNNLSLSIAYMALFGLGTIPLMVTVQHLVQFSQLKFKSQIQKMIPVIMVVIGILFIVRGLGLDIPYLSPSLLDLHVQAKANCH
ncbi:sulfite exporter TauE/SafE family protein [Flavobacterium sp.]|uniref:sulfite exporter TauE/SafE family protein n=1 Tax=Flavobacterium sp. TaxID=239 RepID=UPI0025B90445|nr:sulfite exporter TauE/SafE family protein [Flavobacterium sp.]